MTRTKITLHYVIALKCVSELFIQFLYGAVLTLYHSTVQQLDQHVLHYHDGYVNPSSASFVR